jgi:hypothetical protein
MEPILKPKRTNATAKKAMELVHRKRITLKEAWEEVRRPKTTKSTQDRVPTPAPETQKKSRVIIKRT